MNGDYTEASILQVHVKSSDVPLGGMVDKRSRIRTVPISRTLAGTGTTNQCERLLADAPNRCRAVISLVGQSTDIVWISSSKSDAQNLQGAQFMCGPYPIVLHGTDEIWVGAAPGTNVVVGVVAEYYQS